MQVQTVIDESRAVLQDTDAAQGYRYTDNDLLRYVRDAVISARALRPDIFIGQYSIPIPPSYALADTFPLPDTYLAAVSHYVAGRAEMRDDEFAVDGRAAMFYKSLSTALVKGA